jgi:hypothetical protein
MGPPASLLVVDLRITIRSGRVESEPILTVEREPILTVECGYGGATRGLFF